MNDFLQLNGMILKVQPVGEYDKRITLLTKERGKLTAFARGARRQGSGLMGTTRVFSTGSFRLREGRDAYSLLSAQIDNAFEPLFSDVERTCYGSYFLELADYYAREQMSEPTMMKLLYYALTALTRDSIPNRLARRVYELRMMVLGGQYDAEPPLPCGEACLFTWHFILDTPLEKLFTFALKEEVLEELEQCVDKSLHRYIDRKMNSLEILESL